MVMVAEKSHNLPSVRWRTKKADGINQSECKGLRTKADDAFSQDGRQRGGGLSPEPLKV